MFLTAIEDEFGTITGLGVAGDYMYLGGQSGNMLRVALSGKTKRISAPAVGTVRDIAGGQSGRLVIAVQSFGVYYSDDNGDNWTQGLSDTLTTKLASDGAGTVLGMRSSGADGYISTDNGATFGALTAFGVGTTVSTDGAFSYQSDLGLFVRLGTPQRINVSTNGSSWTSYNQGGLGYSDFSAQAVLGGTLYLGDTTGRVYSSADSGATLSEVDNTFYNQSIGQTTGTFQCRAMGVFDGKVYTSRSSGSFDERNSSGAFVPIGTGASKTSVTTLNKIVTFNGVLWTYGSKLFRSSRTGFFDQSLDTVIGASLGYSSATKCITVIDGIIFVGTSGANIYRLNITTGATKKLSPGGTSDVSGISAGSDGRLIYVQNDGIYTSDDNGDTDTLRESGTNLRILASDEAGTIVCGSTASATGEVSVDNGATWAATALGSGVSANATPQIIVWHSEASLFIRLTDQTINTSADGLAWSSTDHTSTLSTRDLIAQEYHNGKLWFGDDEGRLYTSIDNGVTLTEFINTFYNDETDDVATRFGYGMLFSIEERIFSGHQATALSSLKDTEDTFFPVGISSPEFTTDVPFLDAVKIGRKMYAITTDNILYSTLNN